jgi:HlyD family secretion protein
LAATTLAAVSLGLSLGALRWRAESKELATETVKRAPLDVRITERGNVDSGNNLTLRSLVEGGTGTSILKIAEEGARIHKDEVVVELDSSRLRDEATLQFIKLRSAEAALKNAQSDFDIQKMQNASDVAAAELSRDLARLDLKKYQEAEYIQQRNVIVGEVRMNEEYLVRARERQAQAARLMRRGFTTTKVMDAERVAVAKAQLDLEAAVEKQTVLEEFSYHRELAELQANAVNSERELSRVKLRAQAALSQREATLLARRRTFFLEQQRYEKLQRQIEACVIRSPRDGIVIYANRPESNREPLIYEGAVVRERQPIIHIPDPASMEVTARVHESKISLLHKGLPVTILVDACSGETFHGVVDEVAQVPDSGKWPNFNVKEYTTRVKVTDGFERTRDLKPGMTAGVEILVEQMESALQVPIQSCVERGGRYFAWVVEGEDDVERREIKLGLSNDTKSEVLAGLTEGDEVVLYPRKTLAGEIALLESEIPAVALAPFAGMPLPEEQPDLPDPLEELYPLEEFYEAPLSTPLRDPAIGPLAALPSRDTDRPPSQETPARDPMDAFNWLDQNHDSKVTESELPDPMKPMFTQIDTNHDRAIDKQEWQDAARGQQHKPEPARSGGGQ